MRLLSMLERMDGYLTIAEVAEKYRVSGEHVRRMCVDGRLFAEWVGGVWRIPLESLRVFAVKPRKGTPAASVASGGGAGLAKAGVSV